MIDFLTADSFGTLIKSTREGLGFLREASETAKSVRDAIDAQTSDDAADDATSRRLSVLLQQLIDAQMAQHQVMDRLHVLETALREADRTEKEFARYVLTKTEAGGIVYALKSDDDMGEPDHYLCANCRHDGKKAILQPANNGGMRCYRCEKVTWITYTEPKPPVQRRQSRSWMTY